MSKYVKQLVEDEIAKRLEGVSEFLVINTKGVNGNDNNMLRGELKKRGMRLWTVKNSLARRAFSRLGIVGVESLFMGPCTIAYGGDNVVDIAKEVVKWAKTVKAVEIKAAYVDGDVLDAAAAMELSKMPSRVELQGSIIVLANSPGSSLAGAVSGPASIIAGCIKAIAEKEAA